MKDGILDGAQRGSLSPTESDDDDGDASSSDEQIKRAAIDDSRRLAWIRLSSRSYFMALMCLGVLIAVMGMMLVHIFAAFSSWASRVHARDGAGGESRRKAYCGTRALAPSSSSSRTGRCRSSSARAKGADDGGLRRALRHARRRRAGRAEDGVVRDVFCKFIAACVHYAKS